jgi:hypothetical protein
MLHRRSFHHFREGRFGLAQCDAILRTFGTGNSRLDGSQIQFQSVIEEWRGRFVGAEQHLLLAVGFDESDLFRRTRRELQVRERFLIHRKEAHRCPVFGGHVGNRGTVGNAKCG